MAKKRQMKKASKNKKIDDGLERMDNLLVDRLAHVEQFYDAIGNLLDAYRDSENLEFIEFKISLNEILEKFAEDMAAFYDEAIKKAEKIDAAR